jgi:hypothetical protein
MRQCREEHKVQRKSELYVGVGKLIHRQKWSRPDISNETRDLARFMGCPHQSHMNALVRAMSYVVQTPERGLVLKPDRGWDSFAEHEFVIFGTCDASYHSCPDTCRSVSGWGVFLHGASTENKSKGARDLVCKWSAGGRWRHVDIRQYFLRDLKENGFIWTTWIPSDDNSADLLTKSFAGPLFEKHIRTYVGFDPYMQHALGRGF